MLGAAQTYTYTSDGSQLLITLAVAAVLAFIPAFIAKSKGRGFALWYLYGFLIWIVAFIHSLLLKPAPATTLHGPALPGGPGAIPPMPGGVPPLPPPPPAMPP